MNELEKIFSKNKEINEIKQKIFSYYLGQIANVLLYLKNVGIVHRDIKVKTTYIFRWKISC